MIYQDEGHVAPECYDDILDEYPQHAETGYVNLGSVGWPEVEFEPHAEVEIQDAEEEGGADACSGIPAPGDLKVRNIDAALEYIAKGWPVFPCNIDKSPKVGGGFKAATTDAQQVKAWWSRWPDASIGVPMGEIVGLFVVDIDLPEGPHSLLALEAENGMLPTTLEQRTGSGGRQLFFKLPGKDKVLKNSAGKLGVSIDTRAAGGYVIAPPSKHPSGGHYRWVSAEGTEPADAPAWLLGLLTVPTTKKCGQDHSPNSSQEREQPSDEATANLSMIVPKCAWLRHCRDDAVTLPEPQWYAMLTVLVRCKDGESHSHEWSSPHPKYTRSETDTKMRRARSEAKPRTCEMIKAQFGEYCDVCSETVKSPIVLGRESALPMLPEVKVPELLPPANDLPAGFVRRDDGIWYESKDSKGNYRIERVCSPISVVALTRNHDNEGWGMLVEVTDPDGNVNSWIMEKRLLSSYGDVYRQELLSRGLEINPAYGAQRLHEFISLVHPEKRLRTVSRVGWHGDVFLLPDATYGDAGCEEVRLYPDIKTHNFGVAGDLAEWQENVGKYCVSNSRLLFAVAIALAAPLLQLMDEGSGGFHYFGHSSRGKTTALLVAGSVCGGRGRNGYKSSWRATSNGLEGIAVAHCDGLLCLDEISEVNTRALHEAAYMLSNGMGKARATKSGEARAQAKWRLLYLSTGELTLADKLSEDGAGRATAGQSVRLVDIPAEADEHLGLFEELHGDPDAKTFAERLGKGSREFYGSALRSFLERLTAELPAARGKVARVKEGFQSTYCPPDADSQVTRVCSRFALVAAAGELGIEYGVLPWSQGASVSAAAKCFQAWLRNRGGVGALELQQGVAQVKAFFLKHGSSRFEIWGENESSVTYNRAGFRRKDSNGAWAYYVPKAIFDNEIAKGFDARRLLNEFKRLGLLIPGSDGSPSRVVRDPAIGKTSRYYHFRADIVGDSVTEAPLAPGASLQAVTGDPAGDSGLLQEKDREIKHVTAVTGVTGDSPCNEDAFVSEENVAEILGMGRTRRSAEAQEHTYSF